MQEMREEQQKAFQKIDDERNAERRRWADEIKAIKYVEEVKKNNAINDMKQELHEAFQLLGTAKAGGSLDLHAAAKMLKDYEQTTASSSSSAAATLPSSDRAAREEAIAVSTVEASTDLPPDGDDHGFHLVTGDEV